MKTKRFYVEDIRGAGLCMSGARSYFAHKKWDWNDFLAVGRPCSDLEEAGDMMAMATLACALKRIEDNGRLK